MLANVYKQEDAYISYFARKKIEKREKQLKNKYKGILMTKQQQKST